MDAFQLVKTREVVQIYMEDPVCNSFRVKKHNFRIVSAAFNGAGTVYYCG